MSPIKIGVDIGIKDLVFTVYKNGDLIVCDDYESVYINREILDELLEKRKEYMRS